MIIRPRLCRWTLPTLSLLALFLAACGTLQVGVEPTAAPPLPSATSVPELPDPVVQVEPTVVATL